MLEVRGQSTLYQSRMKFETGGLAEGLFIVREAA